MARFEEIQMRVAESAKNFLELYNMQVFIEQFTLDRESTFYVTLLEMESPFPVSASVSFTFDAFQTGMALIEEEQAGKKDVDDVDNSIELEFTINLPIMKGNPDVRLLVEEIDDRFPEAEPLLVMKEIHSADEPLREYEITYSYSLSTEDLTDEELVNDLFEELRDLLDLVHSRTKAFIDASWYRDQDDSFKGN